MTDRSLDRLAALGGVQAVVSSGSPPEELVRLSAGVDLMVVGSRGLGPLDRFLHGSVSRYLAQNVMCSLLVVPRQAAPGPRAAPAAGVSSASPT